MRVVVGSLQPLGVALERDLEPVDVWCRVLNPKHFRVAEAQCRLGLALKDSSCSGWHITPVRVALFCLRTATLAP